MKGPVDFVIITPLAEERDALLNKFEQVAKLPPAENLIHVNYGGTLPVSFPEGTRIDYRIVIIPLLGMGRVEAAQATTAAITKWKPRYVLLVGIAGGWAKAGVKIGDVLVSDQVADYELQTLEGEKQEIHWKVHPVDPRLLSIAQNLERPRWIGEINSKRPRKGEPAVHFGVVCTGDKVIANGLMEGYREVWSRLVGVEMEAGGAALAAFQAPDKPGFFMIRGVSDLADSKKYAATTKKWRLYACESAAAFTAGLLKSGPVPPGKTPDPAGKTSVGEPRPIPAFVRYLSDRNTQKSELNVAVKYHKDHKPKRPLLCILHGEEREAHDMYLKRLRERTLPEFLNTELPEPLLLPWPQPGPNVAPRLKRLKNELTRLVFDENRDDPLPEDIGKAIMSFKMPVTIETHLSDQDWKADEKLIQKWFKFWETIPDLTIGRPLLIFHCIHYKKVSRFSLFDRKRQRIKKFIETPRYKVNDEDHPTILSKKDSAIHAVTLTELKSVLESEALHWVREHASRFCHLEALLKKVRALFEKKDALPMEELAEQLLLLMNETRKESFA